MLYDGISRGGDYKFRMGKIYCISLFNKHIYYSGINTLFSIDVNDDCLYEPINDKKEAFKINYKVLSIGLNISNNCNMKCAYCFNNNKDNTTFNWSKALDTLNDVIRTYPEVKKIYIDLSGKGEPLLHLNEIIEYSNYFKKLSKKTNIDIVVQFVTNGLLLTKNTVEKLQNQNILFGISIDGLQEIYDYYRKDYQGNSTFNRIIENIT